MVRAFSNDVKNYDQFCTIFGSTQLIKYPNLIACSSTSLTDHILSSVPTRIPKEGVINVCLSGHQCIYCTEEINGIKTGSVD